METYDAIKKRVSVRKYSSQTVSKEDLEKIVSAGARAATANNVQPFEFIVVTGAEKRKELASIAPKNGPYMAESPAVIAVISEPVKYYLEDGSAATQNILLMARDLGLGTVWVAGNKKDYAPAILAALNAPPDHKLVSLVCVGYPKDGFVETPKKKLGEVLHWEKY
ncbi:MAG: nitroreductase family protein [Elusimicrobia bacterium HGW-Elusimicrobia-2]|nr:MAG: nitroreductase family protein [Elusimicrobia bacterium HGW-Elusimicrobia-2]